MEKPAPGRTLRRLRQFVEGEGVREASDGDLLQRFRERRDGAAFQALLRRHGPMVLDVCRAVLGNEASAEDAFQATFLTLARKATSIRQAALVGSWLHRVARRTALQARAQEAARKRHGARAPARPESEPADLTWREARAALHEELDKLPERYRVALVLCYLEGKTQDQAAARLGVAKSTLKERLERGRGLLRVRLVRRGLGPAAVLVAAAWPMAVTSAPLPPDLVTVTGRAADLAAAGQATSGVIPARVAALSEGVMKAMFVTRLKKATAWLAVLALVAGAVTAVAVQARPIPRQNRSATQQPAVAAPAGKDDPDGDVRALRGHRGLVHFAAFSPNGKALLTGAKDVSFKNLAAPRDADEVILWDVAAQRPKYRIQLKAPVHLWCLTLSPDGKTVAVGTSVGIELRDAETGKIRRVLKGPWPLGTGPFSLAFAPDSRTLAAGGSARDNAVRVWDVQSGALTRTLRGHGDAVVGLRFSPDGKTLVSTGGMYDTTIRSWEVASGRLRLTVNKAKEERDGDWQTWPAVFSPDGKIHARGRGAEVVFWDAATGEVKDRVIEDPHLPGRLIASLAFSPDGKLVAGGRNSGEIDLWETRPADRNHDWRIGDRKRTLKGHGSAVQALTFSPSGEFLASGDQDGGVRVWKMAKGR